MAAAVKWACRNPEIVALASATTRSHFRGACVKPPQSSSGRPKQGKPTPHHAHAPTRCKPRTRTPALAFVASHKTRTTTICPFLIGLIRLLNGGAHTVWPLFAAFRYLRIPKQTLEFAKLQNFESKSPHFSHFDKKHTLDRIHFSFQDDENTPHSMGAAVK